MVLHHGTTGVQTMGTVSDVDPLDIFTNGDKWVDVQQWEESALRLHERGPIHRVEVPGYAPFWAVIDHAAVLDVERRAFVFHNAPRPVLDTLEKDAAKNLQMKALVHMDGDEHAAYRRMTSDWFKPSSIARLQDRLDALSRDSVAHLASLGGECDFVREVALPYPLQVILELLGLPQTDYATMLRLTQELFGQDDPDLQREHASPEVRDKIIADFFEYFAKLSADRTAHPTDDLATLIANAVINGEPIPEAQKMGYYIIVATAGHDTTSNAMASGMHLLATHPESLQRIRANPELLINAIEEIVRLASPVRHFMRTVVEETQIAGQTVQPGERVYLSYKAANLDPKVFDDPRTFDIERPNAGRNVSFGYGAHFCLGAQLARNELRSLFGHLVPRLESLELTEPTRMTRATFVGGPKALRVRYRMSAA